MLESPAARLKYLRNTLGLSQKALAETIDLNLYQVRDMEVGKVKISNLISKILSIKFGISQNWLLTGEGEMFAEKDNIHQNQSGSNNIQVGGNMGNIDRLTPTQQTPVPKNQYCIEDEEVAALCFSAYTSAKALGKVDKLKLYLASAVPEILK